MLLPAVDPAVRGLVSYKCGVFAEQLIVSVKVLYAFRFIKAVSALKTNTYFILYFSFCQ